MAVPGKVAAAVRDAEGWGGLGRAGLGRRSSEDPRCRQRQALWASIMTAEGAGR